MGYKIFSDPHLGLRRQAHHSSKSGKRYMACVSERIESLEPGNRACLGDWFDRYSNDEDVIRAGAWLIEGTDINLGGNHDVENIAESVGSLQLISSLVKEVEMAEFGEATRATAWRGDCCFHVVPHVATQTLFETSLGMAAAERAKFEHGHHFLLLHCNYNSPFATNQTSLNLTEDKAKELLEAGFSHILIGHEHVYREELGGRVIMVGSVMPTAWDNVGDKFCLDINLTTGEVKKELIWSQDKHLVHIEMLGDDTGMDSVPDENTQYVHVSGKVKPARMAEVATYIADLWKLPNVISINTTGLEVEGLEADDGEKAKASLMSLPDMIRKELEGGELLELWEEMVRRVA